MDFRSCLCTLIFRLRNPRVWFAFLEILLSWVPQLRSSNIVTLRYLAAATLSILCCKGSTLMAWESLTWWQSLAFCKIEIHIPRFFRLFELENIILQNVCAWQWAYCQIHDHVIGKEPDSWKYLFRKVINVCQKKEWVREQSPAGHQKTPGCCQNWYR